MHSLSWQMVFSARSLRVRKRNNIQHKHLFQWEQKMAPSMMEMINCNQPDTRWLAGSPWEWFNFRNSLLIFALGRMSILSNGYSQIGFDEWIFMLLKPYISSLFSWLLTSWTNRKFRKIQELVTLNIQLLNIFP